MTRVYVIDPDIRPSTAVHVPGGLRIMEADILGWIEGRTVRMAIFGNTAVPPVRADRESRSADRTERWRVYQDPDLGSWVAWVQRPQDDDEARRNARDHRLELLLGCILLFVGAVIAALILVVLPQCNSNTGTGSLSSPPPLGDSAPPAREQEPARGEAQIAVAPF